MKRLIDSKLVKKAKSFLTNKNYNKETNTTEIGGNLEVEKKLVVKSHTINGHQIISGTSLYFDSLKYEDGTTTCNFSPISTNFGNSVSFIASIYQGGSFTVKGPLYGIFCFKFSSPAPSSLSVRTISGMFTPETTFAKANGLWTFTYTRNDLTSSFETHPGVAILTNSEGNSKTYRVLVELEYGFERVGHILLYDPSKENGADFDFINPSALTDTNAITFIF